MLLWLSSVWEERHISISTLQLVLRTVTYHRSATRLHPWMIPFDAMMVRGLKSSNSLLCIGLKCVLEPQTTLVNLVSTGARLKPITRQMICCAQQLSGEHLTLSCVP